MVSVSVEDTQKIDAEIEQLETDVRTAAQKLYTELKPQKAEGDEQEPQFTKTDYFKKVESFTENKSERRFLSGTGMFNYH